MGLLVKGILGLLSGIAFVLMLASFMVGDIGFGLFYALISLGFFLVDAEI